MQNDEELTQQVRETMANTFGVDESEITDDISQENFARWSSLYHMTLLVALEEQFGVTFDMDEMTKMNSLPKIVEALKKHNVGLTA